MFHLEIKHDFTALGEGTALIGLGEAEPEAGYRSFEVTALPGFLGTPLVARDDPMVVEPLHIHLAGKVVGHHQVVVRPHG